MNLSKNNFQDNLRFINNHLFNMKKFSENIYMYLILPEKCWNRYQLNIKIIWIINNCLNNEMFGIYLYILYL